MYCKKEKIIISLLLITVVLLAGCNEQKSTNKQTDNDSYLNSSELIIFSAQKFYEDKIKTKENGTEVIDYKSLEDKDKLLIIDKIDSIGFIESTNDTFIKFQFQNKSNKNSDYYSEIFFIFEGNLTHIYNQNDWVEISVTIKQVEFEYDNKSYNMELFEEEWDRDYLESNNSFKSLPESCIKKAYKYVYISNEKQSDWYNNSITDLYDNNYETYIKTNKEINSSFWTDWIILKNLKEEKCSKIRFLAYNKKSNEEPLMHCQIKINDDTNNQTAMIYDTINGSYQWSDASNYSYDRWFEVSFTPTVVDTAMIRFKAVNGSSVRPKLYEFELL